MNFVIIFSVVLFINSTSLFAQEKTETDLDIAFQNAKKGLYWALSNIPEKKSKLEQELIADDKLYCEVKLYKEVNGVKVESTGFHQTNQVKIIIYKSNDNLEKEGYKVVNTWSGEE
jgi:hypothetical protein